MFCGINFFIKICLSFLRGVVWFFFGVLSTLFVFFWPVLFKFFGFLEKPFIFIVDMFLYYFISIPWYFCGEFLKPLILQPVFIKLGFCKNSVLFTTTVVFFSGWVFFIKKQLRCLCVILWKRAIDFLFFKVWRNRVFLYNTLLYIYRIVVVLLFLHIFSFLHTNFFFFWQSQFGLWDFSSPLGCVIFFCSLFNINNMFLFLFVLFQCCFVFGNFAAENIFVLIGVHWTQYYFMFGLDNQNNFLLYDFVCFVFGYCVNLSLYFQVYNLNLLLWVLIFLVLSVGFIIIISYIYNYFGFFFLRLASLSLFAYVFLFSCLFFCLNKFIVFFCILYKSIFLLLVDLFTSSTQFGCENTPMFFFFGFFFFLTVLFSWLFYSYLGLYGIFQLNLVSLFLFWVSLLFSFNSIIVGQKTFLVKLCSWVFLGVGLRIDYYFLFDTISFSFILLTTTIALFVFMFAFSYFRYEPLVDRFLLFVLSFVISMVFLVSSGNVIMLFLGWELIGLTSFFLINFWTTKTTTLKSAFKAFTFNKVSDFFLFIFLVATYNLFYTFDILSLNNQVYLYEFVYVYLFGFKVSFIEFLSILIICAAFIKSAQFGGHVWLPDSMEAPVPASALIHSATLVSAGVYLILRFNSFFDVTQISKYIIPTIGALTAAYGGVCAVAQSDIKKTLAYSTISHCGFLMVLCATEMNEFTILYLYVHGFFKAGVFMCVGNVLRISRGYQDTRRMGGLLKYLPFEYFCATVGVLNLAGLPFTFGFFIKHLLLISVNYNIYLYFFILANLLIGAISGLFYSYRLITYTFIDFKKGNKVLYSTLNRSNYNSIYYTNNSLLSTISIFCLFLSAYVILYFLFKCLLFDSFLFSDFLNTTTLTTYYTTRALSNGFLINFSHLNLLVVSVICFFLFSSYRFTNKKAQKTKTFFHGSIVFVFWFIFFCLL